MYRAVIPLCDQRTPADALSAVAKSLQKPMIGLVMTQSPSSQENNAKVMLSHLEAHLAVCNAMKWEIAPLLREAMVKARNLCSSGFTDNSGCNEQMLQELGDALDAVITFCNQVHKVGYTTRADENGNIVHQDFLGDHFLEDGEELWISAKDVNEVLPIHLYNSSHKTVEFGGGFHGFEHDETNIAAYFELEGQRRYLRFEDDLLVQRVNEPQGAHISS